MTTRTGEERPDEATHGSVRGLRALLGSVDVVLCDVFGTIHDADTSFPAALEALTRFRAAGGTILLVSNAAARGASLARSLAARGVPGTAYDAIVTSADVARAILADRAAGSVHHIGPEREAMAFEGLQVRLCSIEEADLIVCTGYPDAELDGRLLADAVARRLDLICTNPDTEVAVGSTILRFAGLVAARYRALGGRVIETGKPDASIYLAALERAAMIRGTMIDPARVVAIGDSLALDVAGALRFGLRAVWVSQRSEAAPADTPALTRAHRWSSLAW